MASIKFKAYCLRDEPTGLTFKQLHVLLTLYLRVYVLYLSENEKQLVPLTS
jgi:hypothetical protein